MAVVFSARGDSFDARYSNGGKTAQTLYTTSMQPAVAADASAIGGYVYSFDDTSNNFRLLYWQGFKNTANGRTGSVLVRIKPTYTGSPSSNRCLAVLNAGHIRGAYIDLYHATTGNLSAQVRDDKNNVVLNAGSFGAWSPTANTWYDVVVTWDLSTTSTTLTCYVDASSIGTLNISAAFRSDWDQNCFNTIALGFGGAISSITRHSVNELVLWDTQITPSSVTLTTGSGSLNGASRTAFVDAASFDGTYSTDPGVGNVESAVGYYINGTSYTGTFGVPAQGDVENGVGYGAGGTEFTGNVTLPTEAQTQSGITYGDSGTEFTGTLSPTPTATDIANAVWNAQLTSHTTAGSFGVFTKTLLTLAKFLGLK